MVQDEITNLEEEFPALCFGTTFVALFSFLENEMFKMCDRAQVKQNHKLRYKQIAGQGIEQAKTYLTDLCNVEVPVTGTDWMELRKMQAVRNIIVHRRGVLDPPSANDRDKDVRNYLSSKAGTELKDDTIVLKEPFLMDAIDLIERFVDQLYQTLEAVLKEPKK